MSCDTRNTSSAVFLLAALLIGSGYWIGSWALNGRTTLDQAVLFRPGGDPDYLPQVSALAHLEFGETSVREMAGRGLRSFPFVSVLLHATLSRFWGDLGFVVADILAFVLYGWVLTYFLKNAGVTRCVAEALALLVLSGALSLIVKTCAGYGIGRIPVAFWNPRFPRDLITEFFVVAFLGLASRFVNDTMTRTQVSGWVLMGLLGACLLQSDIYQAADMSLVATFIVFYLFVTDSTHSTALLRGMVVAGGVAAILCTPFVYQRFHESPDVLRRWGVFSIGHRVVLLGSRRLFMMALLTLSALLCYYLREKANGQARAGALVIGATVVASLLSGPLSLLVLGQGVQIYQYPERAELAIGYALLLCTGWAVQGACRWLHQMAGTHRILVLRISNLVFVTAVVGCLAVKARSDFISIRGEWPTAVTKVMAAFPEPRYRSSFAELRSELMRPQYQPAEVLGTFDAQLADWWEYRNKYLYLPDLFNSTVPDREVEARVYTFLRLTGATPENFSQLLDNWYFLVRVVGGGKYLANALYTPWPTHDYSIEAQRRLASTPIADPSWHMELPLPERGRLLDGYAHFDLLAAPSYALDVIVLSKDDLRRLLHPERGRLTLAWANDRFEIWVPHGEGASRRQPRIASE